MYLLVKVIFYKNYSHAKLKLISNPEGLLGGLAQILLYKVVSFFPPKLTSELIEFYLFVYGQVGFRLFFCLLHALLNEVLQDPSSAVTSLHL